MGMPGFVVDFLSMYRPPVEIQRRPSRLAKHALAALECEAARDKSRENFRDTRGARLTRSNSGWCFRRRLEDRCRPH